MVKRTLAIFLATTMLFLLSVSAFGAEETNLGEFEFPTPQAPNYFVYTDGDANEGHHDDLRMIMVADPEVALLAAEYYADSEAFYEKYGLYSFAISMQYDVSLDDEEHWQHNEEWDTNWYTGGYADGYPYVSLGSEMMEDFEFFWLTYHEGQGSDTFVPYQPAIITEYYYYSDGYEEEIYSFDVENHSLYIRCRYYMEWEPLVENEYGEGPGEKQSKFSDWSESAVFGKNSTQVIPDEPTTYEAPVISDLKIVLPEGHGNSQLEYVQTTPESVWLANVYYMMAGEGQFDGLETQVSINGGEWIPSDTANAWGDWCLWNGNRVAGWEHLFGENTNVKLRIRFTGTHGPSPWSNVLEVNGGEDCPSAHFTDIGAGDWYHEAVDFAVENGLFGGMSATTFEPNTAMTRAMLVTVLWRYEGSPAEGTTSFTDVPDGQWYTDAVAWAAHNGIVGGVGNNRFDPNGNITREQMATILFRYSNSLGLDTSDREELDYFPDGDQVSAYALDALSWAVSTGLINGSEGKLLPQGNATRAQVATILMRFIENVAV